MRKFCSLLILCSSFAFALDEDYVIEMRAVPILDAIRLLAQMQNKNFVGPEGIEGTVTASFPKSKLGPALDVVLASKDLGKIEENNVIRIATKKTLEERGEDLISETVVLKYGKGTEVKGQISTLLSSRGIILVDSRTNTLTIRDNKANIKNMLAVIERIDKRDRQVLIEARIVEASVDFTRGLGVDWGMTYNQGNLSLSRTNPLADTTTALNIGLSPLNNMNLDFALVAAETEGKVNIISRPSIVTLNNQPATIKSGLKFYVKIPGSLNIGSSPNSTEGSQTTTSNTANLKEIESGVAMTVTPQITADDKISLVINVSESQPNIAKAVDGLPTIQDNTASTTVTLDDGQVTVIGGLFHTQDSVSEQGLPFLRGIPILGPLLFGTQSKSKIKKELLIFIKPSIVKNSGTTDKLLDNLELVKDQDIKIKP
jgi:type IV pilus assembly protein PilQ